jgi:superfamily II helicase
MTEYAKSFMRHVERIADLVERSEELDKQIEKLKRLAAATYDLMDEDEKVAYSEALKKVDQSDQSLTQALRRVLTQAGREYLSPMQIREQLVRSGYNFDGYQSNPLVSVHSTLNRMKDELEVVILGEGAKGYRFRR